MQVTHCPQNIFEPHGFFVISGKSYNPAHLLGIGLGLEPQVLTIWKTKAENTCAVCCGWQSPREEAEVESDTHIQHPLHSLTHQRSHTSPKTKSECVIEKDQRHIF